MNPLLQCKPTILQLFIAGVLACFGPLSGARAVVPAPDGGYPGGNTAEGQNALLSLTTGGFNTAVGFLSLRSDTTGSFNTATGAGSLFGNTTAERNTANGALALFSNTTGGSNTAIGLSALFSNTTGFFNTANGAQALISNTTGSFNTAIGFNALASNTAGANNTAIGDNALGSNTTGLGNTAIGSGAGSNVISANSVICIGSPGANVTASCFIAHIRGVTVQGDAVPVLIDTNGQLGTTACSARFKKEIQPMDKASEAILALKPVTFRYKNHENTTPQFGLIAEEVAEVNPDLVVRDENGEIYTARYYAVNAMLLNEFLKEHRTVQELKSTVAKQEAIIAKQQKGFESKIAAQQKQIEVLSDGLQKVSAQLEASKPAPQVVNDP